MSDRRREIRLSVLDSRRNGTNVVRSRSKEARRHAKFPVESAVPSPQLACTSDEYAPSTAQSKGRQLDAAAWTSTVLPPEEENVMARVGWERRLDSARRMTSVGERRTSSSPTVLEKEEEPNNRPACILKLSEDDGELRSSRWGSDNSPSPLSDSSRPRFDGKGARSDEPTHSGPTILLWSASTR